MDNIVLSRVTRSKVNIRLNPLQSFKQKIHPKKAQANVA